MSLTKPDRPRNRPHRQNIPLSDYLGWVEGSHVWWILNRTERRHGMVTLQTKYGSLDAESPWVEIQWDDGGVLGAVPSMMTDLCMRAGWQVLSPSLERVRNGKNGGAK